MLYMYIFLNRKTNHEHIFYIKYNYFTNLYLTNVEKIFKHSLFDVYHRLFFFKWISVYTKYEQFSNFLNKF